MLQKSSGQVAGDVDWRLLAPLLAHVVITHVVVGILRVTMSYRTVELGLPAIWLGAIAAGFALLPIFVALRHRPLHRPRS